MKNMTTKPRRALQCVINLGNPLLAHAQGTHIQGISVDIANAWAQETAQDCALIVVQNAREAVELLEEKKADLGFVANDPARAKHLRFTKAYLHIDGCYLVRESSDIKTVTDVDSAQHRVVVGLGSAYDLFLSRHLKEAHIVKAASSDTVVDTFIKEQAQVAAGVKHQLEMDMRKHKGLRILPGHFMQIQQCLAIHQEAGEELLAALQAFLNRYIQDGKLNSSMQKHHVTGAVIDNTTN